jgi:hypothetical protein
MVALLAVQERICQMEKRGTKSEGRGEKEKGAGICGDMM